MYLWNRDFYRIISYLSFKKFIWYISIIYEIKIFLWILHQTCVFLYYISIRWIFLIFDRVYQLIRYIIYIILWICTIIIMDIFVMFSASWLLAYAILSAIKQSTSACEYKLQSHVYCQNFQKRLTWVLLPLLCLDSMVVRPCTIFQALSHYHPNYFLF